MVRKADHDEQTESDTSGDTAGDLGDLEEDAMQLKESSDCDQREL